MKTRLLYWDVAFQALLLALNLLILCIPWLWYYLLVPIVVIWSYQFISGAVNLLLNHKSIGYRAFRKLHFITAVMYPAFLAVYVEQAAGFPVWVGTAAIFIVPQAILFAYCYLCYSELSYLKHREFFILK